MFDLRIVAGTVITVDGERRVLRPGAVAVENGRIAAVGHPDAVPGDAGRTIDVPDGIVLPGLVDTHGHAGHSLIRTLGGDDLAAWLDACGVVYLHGSTVGFWRADARLSAVERLLAGTTTGLSMFGGSGDTIRIDDPVYALAHTGAVAEVGIRDVVVLGPGAPPFPKSTTDHSSGRPQRIASSFDDQMKAVDGVIAALQGSATNRVALTYPTLTMADVETVTPTLVAGAERVARAAADNGMLIVQDGHSGDSVLASERLGLLGPRTVLSHATDLGEAEISVLAAAGSSIAHNPTAVFSQLGRCPVPELLEAGVNVALGSDATAPDRPSDMFRQMFGLTRYHRALRRDPALIPPGLALEMATVRAAEALGMGGEVGSLTPGLLADVIVLDGARPHLTPLIHPVHQIVYYASGSDVSHVVVGGEVLVDDGVVTSVDVAEILAEAREEHSAAIARSGLEALLGDRDGTWGAIRYPEGSGLGS